LEYNIMNSTLWLQPEVPKLLKFFCRETFPLQYLYKLATNYRRTHLWVTSK